MDVLLENKTSSKQSKYIYCDIDHKRRTFYVSDPVYVSKNNAMLFSEMLIWIWVENRQMTWSLSGWTTMNNHRPSFWQHRSISKATQNWLLPMPKGQKSDTFFSETETQFGKKESSTKVHNSMSQWDP